MQSATLNGLEIHYEVSGPADGPTIVFSNSLGTDFRVWSRLLPRLGDQFRFVRYDKRGHGLSDPRPSPYRMEDHIGDLSALMDHLEIGPAIICGLSVGGIIAQGLAAGRPDLVRALVLCDTAHKIGTAEMWNDRIAAVEQGGIEALADGILERWFSKAARQKGPAEIAIWRNMLVRTPAHGYMGTSAAIRDTDFTELAKTIAVPTLCAGGSEDGSTPPELMRELTALIPGAGFVLIEGAGHLPCVEKPEALAQAMRAFFAENGLA